MQIKGDTRKLLAAIAFFISFALLLRFVDLFRNGVEQNFIFFWLLILCIFTSVMYQIFRFGNSGGWQWLIIFQIMLITFFFQTISLLLTDGSMLLGDDAFLILKSAQHIRGHPDFFITGPEYSKWPISQLLALATSELCNIKLFTVFKFLPSIVSTLGILFVYLIAREVYDTRRGGLLACLLFSSLFMFGVVHSRFHPQFLGFVFFLACLFVYFKSTKTGHSNIKYISLAILFMLVIMATNYTSNAFLVAFFIVALIYGMVRKYVKEPSPTTTGPWSTSFTFVALALVAWLAYAMYITEPLFSYVTRTATELTAPVTYGTVKESLAVGTITEPVLRTYISGWGQIAYVFIFGAIILFGIFWSGGYKHRHAMLLFTLWGGVGLLVYLGTVLFVMTKFGSVGLRLQVFVYPFVLMSVAHIILRLGGKKRRMLFSLLLIGFLLINVAAFSFVPPNLIDHAAQPVSYGDWKQEIRASEWLPGDEPVVSDYMLNTSLWYIKDIRPSYDIAVFEDDMSGLRSFSWLCLTDAPAFYVHSKEYGHRYGPVLLDEQTLYEIPNTPWLNKAYDNGEWEIYRVAPEHGNK